MEKRRARTSPRNHAHVERPGIRRNLSRSATRALDVLDFMASHSRPPRAIEIANGLDLSPSTLDQLLKSMADSGYVVFDPRLKVYYPSPRLSRLASWVDGIYYGQDVLQRQLEQLFRASGALVLISTMTGPFVQIVQSLAPAGWESPVESGTRLLLVESTLGKVLLTGMTEQEVLELCGDMDVDPVVRSALLGELQQIRSTGYLLGSFTQGNAVASIAMPMPATRSGLPLVVSLSDSAPVLREREGLYLSLLKAFVTALSA
jgi:DNA-binding IclR family transcriptional regulator